MREREREGRERKSLLFFLPPSLCLQGMGSWCFELGGGRLVVVVTANQRTNDKRLLVAATRQLAMKKEETIIK